MTNKSPVRSCEDIDEDALSYAEIKALCAGNPLIKEKMQLDMEVQKLKTLKTQHTNQTYSMEADLHKHLPEKIAKTKGYIEACKLDIELLRQNAFEVEAGISPMIIRGVEYTNRDEAGKALLQAAREVKPGLPLVVGEFKGFEMSVQFVSAIQEYVCKLKGNLSYTAELSGNPSGSITRIDNALSEKSVDKWLENNVKRLEEYEKALTSTKELLGKPFPQEEELKAKMSRLVEVDMLIELDGRQTSESTESDVAKEGSDKDAPEKKELLKKPTQDKPGKNSSPNTEPKAQASRFPSLRDGEKADDTGANQKGGDQAGELSKTNKVQEHGR